MEPVTRVGDGAYRVEVDGRATIVYVAGPPHDRWVFWNGHVYRGDFRETAARPNHSESAGAHAIVAPMPATVVAVHVKAGDTVSAGQVVMLLEAMKMELPIRAPHDARVAAVHARAGELVQADAPLLDLE